MSRFFLLIALAPLASIVYSQDWNTQGNLISGLSGDRFVGTLDAASLRFKTDGVLRAAFPFNNSISGYGGGGGSGLRIFNVTNPSNPIGVLDLFTTSGNKTHVGFGTDGTITGGAGRMEYYAKGAGFWFNAMDPLSRAIWTRSGVENARMGVNGFWRFGLNPGVGVDAARRVEVLDNAPQLRLSRANGVNFAEFFARPNGTLLIMPNSNGQNTGFTSAGNTGYDPTERIDVDGTARLRNVPTGTANCLLIGTNNTGMGDVTVTRLEFNGNATDVLLGNGTFGPAPASAGVNTAINGAWINSSGEIEWGTNPLIHPTTLPLGQNNLLFKTFLNEPGVITFGGSTLGGTARVIVNNDLYQNGFIVNAISPVTIPIKYGTIVNADNANRLTAILGNAKTGTSVQGVYGFAQDGLLNTTGVRGVAQSTSNQSTNIGGDFNAAGVTFIENIGVRGYADGSVKNNFGGKFKAGGTGTLSIGVYGESAPSNPATGSIGYAGYFAGTVVETQGSLWPSDSTLKQNVTPLDITSDSLMQLLTPVSYEYIHSGNAARLNLAEGTKFGFLAQQVEQYFPTAVQLVTHPAEFDSLGNEIAPSFQYKAVDMSQLIPVMMSDLQRKSTVLQNQSNEINNLNNQIQVLESQVSDLNNRLTNLENCLSALLPTLCQMNQSAIQANTSAAQEAVRQNLQVTLSNRSTIILDQNVPNPFAEQTVINFSIPASVAKAQMHFYDGNGRLIQTLEIAERGLGAVTVFGSDLSSGTYTYTLVADGAVVATKKMMKL